VSRMYIQKQITTQEILSVYHLRKQKVTQKDIARQTGLTFDKVNWILDHLRDSIARKIMPRKHEYFEAVKQILTEEKETALLEEMLLAPKTPENSYTSYQLVHAYSLRKEGVSFGNITKITGVKNPQTVLGNIDMFFSFPDKYERASDEYKKTIDTLRGDSTTPEATPTQTLPTSVTTTDMVTMWKLAQGKFSYRKIAEQLGWVGKGSVDRVRQVLRNLDFYLAENTYCLIREKKQAYRKARDIIYAEYTTIHPKKDIMLRHDGATDTMIALPTMPDESEIEEPTIAEKLDDAARLLRKAVNRYIKDYLGTSLPDTVSPQAVSKQQSLIPIDDNGTQGYLLTDLEASLDEQTFHAFEQYHHGQPGGIYHGQYYVLKADVDRFIHEQQNETK
jgi:hypothetical protein